MLYITLFLLYVKFWMIAGASYRQGVLQPEICESKECYDAANHIKKWMNPAFKPCEDFYEFTCGYWHSPDNKTVNKKKDMSLGSREDFVVTHLKKFLLDDTIDKESKLFHTMKLFLNTCLDEESIEARGVSPAVSFLRKAGGWPVLEEHWSEEKWDLLNAEISVGGLFFKIDIHPREPDNIWTYVIVPKYNFDDSFNELSEELKEDYITDYLKEKCDLAEMFGADRSEAEEEMRDVLQFEIDMSELRKGLNDSDNLKSWNISQLQTNITWVNWTQLLTALLPGDVPLVLNETVTVVSPTYLNKLGSLISRYPKRTVANYVMSKAASSLRKYLPTTLYKVRGDDSDLDPRFRMCVEMTQTGSFMGVLASYIARQTVEETRVAKEMAQHILDELLIDLKQLEWLDEETRLEAINTLQETRLLIAFPDELLDMDKVEELYKEVKVNTSYFFEAMIDSDKWMRQEKFRKIGTSLSDMSLQERIEDAMSIGAYFRIGANYIVVTAGFLNFLPLFSPKVPLYVNYGHLGGIIAHELTHALDVQTATFENSTKDNWGDEGTKEMYEEKKQCIIDQYSSFNDSKNTGKTLNSNQTDREDIADNGGLKLAFRAYKRMAAQLTTPEPKLPNLQQYSNEQMFLISLTNAYCEIPNKDRLLAQLKYDSHSPFEFRVKGMMMNLPDFSKLFGCKIGDPMNPKEKCEVWYLVSK